jgi:hypothetical protein
MSNLGKLCIAEHRGIVVDVLPYNRQLGKFKAASIPVLAKLLAKTKNKTDAQRYLNYLGYLIDQTKGK